MPKSSHLALDRPHPSRATGKADLITQIRTSGLNPPESMTLMVTDGCNLHCRHCWLDCRSVENAEPVAASRIMGLIDAFAALGGTRINLTGGEILSHRDWHLILAFCLNHAGIHAVCLQTNATLITHAHLESLLDLHLHKLTIQVSLDGACARTHNLVRGSGSYARAMSALRLLAKAGLAARTQVAFTEMAHNFHELPLLLEIVERFGIGRLISSTIIKGGRAAASPHLSLPTPNQYWELIDLYQNDSRFRMLCDQKADIAAIEWFKHRTQHTDCTCSCLRNIFVDARGQVYPCTMLLLERYASESVYAQPLERVIQNALARWSEIPLLNRRRQKMLSKCNRCLGKNHCGGGCLGRSASARGDIMDPEDRCSLRKAVYYWTMLPGSAAFCGGARVRPGVGKRS